MIRKIYNILLSNKAMGMTAVMFVFAMLTVSAQERVPKAQQRRSRQPVPAQTDTLRTLPIPDSTSTVSTMPATDSTAMIAADGTDTAINTALADTLAVVDSLLAITQRQLATEMQVKKQFVPDSKKAMWLAIVFPGGGQIYNRKYWKLPLIYGGFLGCVYALNWNGTMYRDYSQAYIDIMDDDPNTKSYEDFLPTNYDVNANKQRIQDLFRRKKDYYRRYRDLSIFCMIGVYALSVIDAYVDAELSSFDISRELSMKVRPSVINSGSLAARSPYPNQSYGVQCSLSF